MLKILIVDDERNSRELLKTLVEKYYSSAQILGLASNIKEGKALMENEKPDLLFLDIELGGETGFEFLDSFDYEKVLVCFVTGYDQYAIRAIKYRAFDYLLKPVDISELKKVLNEAHRLKIKEPEQNSSITINEGQKTNVIDLNEIMWIEADSSYTIINLTSGKKIVSNKSLSYFDLALPENIFHRTHKSFIVSLLQIKEVELSRTGQIALKNDQSIPIASRRIKDFRDKMSKLGEI